MMESEGIANVARRIIVMASGRFDLKARRFDAFADIGPIFVAFDPPPFD